MPRSGYLLSRAHVSHRHPRITEHRAERIHDRLQLLEIQLSLATSNLLQPRLQLDQSSVNRFVRRLHLHLALEGGHLARQHGEYMRFLDVVVHREGGAELQPHIDELADREARGSLVGFAGGVEGLPVVSEVVVVVVHVLGHVVVLSEF